MYIHLSVTQFTVLPYRLLSSALTKPLSIIRHSVCIFICIIYQYVLGSSALALFFSNLSAHSIPRLLINHPLLKQPFIKVLEPYRLRHFSFLHLRAHLRHAPINRLTALCQAFSLSECLRECNLLLSHHIRKTLMGIWQTKFLCRKKYSGTPERRNTAFFATFQSSYWFCKIRYEYEKRAAQPSGQTALQYTFFNFWYCVCAAWTSRVNIDTHRLNAKLRQQHFRLHLIRQHWTPIQQFPSLL